MKNLYQLEEYSGRLPNPKHFPIREGIIVAIKDKPYTFSDGFMLDLSVREADKEILTKKVVRTLDTTFLRNNLEKAIASKLLLSKPEFIYDTTYPVYILFTPSGNAIPIQIKYYKYFVNRYPKCSFYLEDNFNLFIAVKVNEGVVGICMSMLFEKETLNQIKEERK